ncbi:transcription factor bHLH111 [Malania oleifera]|uniref:transcription factor bHLH111 n=1 Tax=Malania oleifera TaxID=397392 RepID=UPI0025ADB219|nr:transcription factor bHLH111 [Malania oleifera]
MADECTESSVATSSSTHTWWDLHSSSLSSWNNSSPWQPPRSYPSSHSSKCEEDASISTPFTNASNHSGLSVDSSNDQLIAETASASDHLWSQVLLSGVESNRELQDSQGVGENLLHALSAPKNLSTRMHQPATDYLKKLDNSWEFSGSTCSNDLENLTAESERQTRFSNLVCNWSIAPPDPQVNPQLQHQPYNLYLSSSMDHHYSPPDICHETPIFTEPNKNSGLFSCYGHEIEVLDQNEHRKIEAPRSSVVVGQNSGCYYGMNDLLCTVNARNFSEVVSFSSKLSKPLLGPCLSTKPCQKSSGSSYFKKQTLQTNSNSRTRNNGKGHLITNEAKKKRSEHSSEIALKKPKHGISAVSSVELQAPKVKLGDRISTLQQIVSPFGKTDTASVLLEALGYIRFLQEQVQLLSSSYTRTNTSKDQWGELDRNNKSVKLDLRSKGLCLVPISSTPQIYHKNTGSEYWTPTYRGFLYK